MSLPTTNLPLFQIGNQWSDKNGFLTPITAQFVQNLMARVGASSAPSNTALADAIAGSGGPTISITVGASPFTYQAAAPGTVIISDGGLQSVQFSRDGINFFSTGSFRGMFPLNANDQLRVTYMAVPTMTFVPR